MMHSCVGCGYRSRRWYVTCPLCHGHNTMVTMDPARELDVLGETQLGAPGIVSLDEALGLGERPRYRSGLDVWDDVLGEGQLPGTVVLLGGDPGLGKSTLALQVLSGIQGRSGGVRALYVSSEEPLARVRGRAQRLGLRLRRLHACSEQILPFIERACRQWGPSFVVVDSIQAVYDPEFEGAPGSVGQVRRAGWRLVQLARELNAAMLLLAHVDKSGGLAGPMVLQHDVDAVVMLEGVPDEPLRILRARKNRFGPTTEMGRCEMTERGLF